jgi:hypothetical protein
MADSTFKTLLKNKLRAIFGAGEDSSGSLKTAVDQLATKRIVEHWPRRKAGAITNDSFNFAHTASKSLSQPVLERVIYQAHRECYVGSAAFAPNVSSTTTASASASWTLLINKRGKGTGTFSGSWSVTSCIGGLTSCTKKDGDTTVSVSVFKSNVAFCPNPLGLTKSSTKIRLKRGDVLTARIRKGRVGHADDAGAWFPGGKLEVTIVED